MEAPGIDHLFFKVLSTELDGSEGFNSFKEMSYSAERLKAFVLLNDKEITIIGSIQILGTW